jgi:SAM-dependent methyltransferase
VSSITRENHAANQALSLRERIATESREWDEWALKNQHLSLLLSQELPPGTTITLEMQQRFPHPFGLWTTMPGYFWEYQHLGSMIGKTVLQLAGHGQNVIRFILAGATQGYGLDPSIETLKIGHRLAQRYHVHDKILWLDGIAEQLPFDDNSIDRIYGGAVLHHTLLDQAAKELYRVLTPGGRAAFHEPLEGSRVVRWARQHLPYPGKGQAGVDYPLSYEAIHAFISAFDAGTYREFEMFGTPMNFLMRVRPGFRRLERALRPIDAWIGDHVPAVRRFAKGVGICVSKRG